MMLEHVSENIDISSELESILLEEAEHAQAVAIQALIRDQVISEEFDNLKKSGELNPEITAIIKRITENGN